MTLRRQSLLVALAVLPGLLLAGCGGSSSATLSAIAVTPSPLRLAVGNVGQLVVTGINSDGTRAPIVAGLTFSSDASAVAAVSSSGVVTGLAEGSATITAAASGLTANVTVTVSSLAPTLVSIDIIPSSAQVAIRGTEQLTVSGLYSDFSTFNVTAGSTFVSSSPGVATVSAGGLVTGVSAGSTTVVATHTASGRIATATVFVVGGSVAPTLVSIAVTPASSTLAPGATQQLTVTGTYSDSSTANLTSGSTFVSSATGAATVSAAGLVTAVAVGTATVTATHTASSKTATSAITVSSGGTPTLSSIAVSPASVSLAIGATQQLTVTGTYSDSSTANLTSGSTFLSSATGVATVSAGGLVTAVAVGTATVTATHTASGKTATSAVTVSSATTTGGLVFFDGYDAGVTFVDFGGSANNVTVDTVEKNNGRSSLKFVVTSSATAYSGGAFVASVPRNLSAFNALTFWAKASTSNTLPVTGIGNDAATPQGFSAESLDIPLTGTWTKYTIPIPVPSKLTSNKGLFHLADGANKNYTIWLNDIQYENLPSSQVGPPTLSGTNVGWETGTTTVALGATHQIPYEPNTVGFALPVLPHIGRLTNVSFRYFDLTSSAPGVATVNASGLVTGVSAGSANITATLGGLAVPGQQAITVSGTAAPAPAAPPAAPTALPADAISLFSSTFTGTAADKSGNVDTWFASWSGTGGSVVDFTIPGTTHVVKKYELKNYIGIEFIGGPASTPPVAPGANLIDITTPGMTHMHMDVWTPDGSHLVIKLQDAGADKLVVNGDPVKLWPVSLIGKNQWISLDLSIAAAENQGAAWTGKNTAQIVISLDTPNAGGTLYLDNLYFYKSGGGGGGGAPGPATAAAPPTAPVANVLSLFSSAYTGTAADRSANVNSYNATCFGPGGSSVADYTIPGTSHVVKQYTVPANNFAIIELIGSVGGTPSPPDSATCHGGTQSTTGSTLIDVTTMTGGLRFDVWSPAGSTKGTNQQVVSADGTNTIAGPGAAAGATQGTSFGSATNPIAAGQWVTIDFPWASSGPPGAPAGLNKVALVKFFFLDAGTYYIDNVYFYK
jgi:uncharacterized protein YjdB